MNTEEMVTAVRDWMDKSDWKYEYHPEDQIIQTAVTFNTKIETAPMFVDFKEDSYLVYVVLPVQGDRENLGELLKYVAMANAGQLNGNFEIDVRDGEVSYKSYVNCAGLKELSEDVVMDSICVGCAMMERYGDGLVELAKGVSDAETEIEKAEKKVSEE